jgi:hypothetical protein
MLKIAVEMILNNLHLKKSYYYQAKPTLSKLVCELQELDMKVSEIKNILSLKSKKLIEVAQEDDYNLQEKLKIELELNQSEDFKAEEPLDILGALQNNQEDI